MLKVYYIVKHQEDYINDCHKNLINNIQTFM